MNRKKYNKIIANLEVKLNKVAREVKQEIDNALNAYYNEYHPKYYVRTDQLKHCCKISDPIISKNKLTIYVYLDIKNMHYNVVKGSDPYKTVESANVGLHGGWNVMQKGSPLRQVPYDEYNKKTDADYGGVSIWREPMYKLFKKGEIEKIFKKYGFKNGIRFSSGILK